jgi:hypothetical protein
MLCRSNKLEKAKYVYSAFNKKFNEYKSLCLEDGRTIRLTCDYNVLTQTLSTHYKEEIDEIESYNE